MALRYSSAPATPDSLTKLVVESPTAYLSQMIASPRSKQFSMTTSADLRIGLTMSQPALWTLPKA